ncbi:hypothetical protein cyc_05053 [Cyclospora cayetanensis]|uniref:Uncharacterized protein n=1 Tax=Cyclospora cayetanensis TaxID=88456 RepID=A0A1D3D3R5_9EIME|nr:hypothetical protein cyc_05053 [Cyclospora cayetanensis]
MREVRPRLQGPAQSCQEERLQQHQMQSFILYLRSSRADSLPDSSPTAAVTPPATRPKAGNRLTLQAGDSPAYRQERQHAAFLSDIQQVLQQHVVASCGSKLPLQKPHHFLLALQLLAEQTCIAKNQRQVQPEGTEAGAGIEWHVQPAVFVAAAGRPPLDFFRCIRKINRQRLRSASESSGTPIAASSEYRSSKPLEPFDVFAFSQSAVKRLIERLPLTRSSDSNCRTPARNTRLMGADGELLSDLVFRDLLQSARREQRTVAAAAVAAEALEDLCFSVCPHATDHNHRLYAEPAPAGRTAGNADTKLA